MLLERGRLPRQRVCGEFVSAESLALLESLLPSDSALITRAPRISKGRLFVDGRVISTEIDPAAASIARFDLDQALWQSAERQNVEAHLQSTAENIEGCGPFQITTASGQVEAKVVVNTTGRWSNLSPGGSPRDASGKKWLGVKTHFYEEDPAPSVDLYFFEGGYCGVQPAWLAGDDSCRGHRVNACAMVQAEIASSLRDVFRQHRALAERSRHWTPLMDPVRTSPLIFREPQPVQGGVFQAGDAAGFVDPFVGDGISLALRSGVTAGRSVVDFIRGETSRAEAEARYARAYRQELLPIFRNSARLRQLLHLPRILRSPLAGLLENAPALANYMVRSTR
jgi:flavin-dependent dehydrogenase